ncbi:MAG: hypothetical protein JRF33_01620 [Deltaproteobacteria bacterium]|nr:hypothetical protein [Deltaproteobacteria bacterium]
MHRADLAEFKADMALAAQPLGPNRSHPALSINLIPETQDRFPWSQLAVAEAWGPSLDLHFSSQKSLLLAACIKGKAILGGHEIGSRGNWNLLLAELDTQDGHLRWARQWPQAKPSSFIFLGTTEGGQIWLASDSEVKLLGPKAEALWSAPLKGKILDMEHAGAKIMVLASRQDGQVEQLLSLDKQGKTRWVHPMQSNEHFADMTSTSDGAVILLTRPKDATGPCRLRRLDATGLSTHEMLIPDTASLHCEKLSTGPDGRIFLGGTSRQGQLTLLRLPKLRARPDWRVAWGELKSRPGHPSSFISLAATAQGDLTALVHTTGHMPMAKGETHHFSWPHTFWLMLRPSSFSLH